jgi:hypothetical protein
MAGEKTKYREITDYDVCTDSPRRRENYQGCVVASGSATAGGRCRGRLALPQKDFLQLGSGNGLPRLQS